MHIRPIFTAAAAAVALGTVGCASLRSAGGESGGAVVSGGENASQRERSGAASDSVATNGSDPAEPAPAR